jgi:ABC-type antimicrobial peptide transport system permease subunit
MVNEPVRISADGKVIPSERRIKEQNNARILEEKLDASPLFLSWEFGQNPNQFNTTFFAAQFRVQGGEYKDCAYGSLSSGYMNMFNIKMKEGRMWDPKQDQNNGYKLMINETAKKLFGIDHIGEIRLESSRRLWYDPAVDYNSIANYEIVGVIEDFRSRHLSQPVLPLVISYTDKGRRDEQLILHIAPGKHQEAIAFVSDLYDELVGDGRFEYTSFEDEIAGLYAEDRKVATIYSSFALIAILVSAMGLFGLSLFDIRQRYREIALRKVNGATFKDIRKLLFIKYMRLLLLSFAVAAPIASLFLHRYLQDYATHAPISWWIFAVAAILTMAVAMLTLLWQVQKASKLNPADAIRTE